MTPQEIHELIVAGLPGATVTVQSDDNTHFVAQVVSDEFCGLRPLCSHINAYTGRSGTKWAMRSMLCRLPR